MIKLGFKRIDLDDQHGLWLGRLPPEQRWTPEQFDAFWALHPDGFHQVRLFGRLVAVPRWSETYGRDYRFSGTVQSALPIPDLLAPLLAWSQAHIDPRFNGLLVNWYDGSLGHKIGAHRDDEKELLVGAPILTISFGENRTFRLRPWQGQLRTNPGAPLGDGPQARPRHDIEVADASVLVLPYATNMAFTHEVPASKRRTGRRISVTVRAFGA